MDELEVYVNQQKQLNNQTNQCNKEIKRLQNAYDSLCRFKNVVNKSFKNFDSINGKQKNYLESINTVSNNNKVVKHYYKGMKKVFSGIGSKVVRAAFIGFLFLIDKKKKYYLNQINIQKNAKVNINNKINSINKSIDKIKSEKKGK